MVIGQRLIAIGGSLGLVAVVAGASLAYGVVHPAIAQSGTGLVTGRVAWSACIPYPLPLGVQSGTPGQSDQGQPSTVPAGPDSSQAQPAGAGGADTSQAQVPGPGGGTSAPFRILPAGAALVAVQGTNVSTRTDENGAFTLQDVPAGEYLTVAAGPVAAAGSAAAIRPNVTVDAGQTVDLGMLALAAPTTGIACRFPPGAGAVPGAPTGAAADSGSSSSGPADSTP